MEAIEVKLSDKTVNVHEPWATDFGLFTRVATLPLLGMVFVIQTLVYPENWPEHLTWATLLLLILTRGPGIVSIDGLLSYGLVRRQAA